MNQTMRDIQIICVNDGSTDGSPAILEAYAAKDTRIEIIHQENQGGGSARNAAYPHIRGKYAYFVDPDDWIELDLCQQCWDKAEKTEADMVVLRAVKYRSPPVHSPPFDSSQPEVRRFPGEKHDLFGRGEAWNRFWLTDFLLSNNIRFSEGKRPYNDVFAAWKGIVLANRIATIDNLLYHYRVHQASYQQTINKKHLIVVKTFLEVETMLHETGQYDSYRNIFISRKLNFWHDRYYYAIPVSVRNRYTAIIRESLSTEDREFYRTAPKELIPRHIRWFYEMIDGSPGLVATVKYYISLVIFGITKKSPRQIFRWFIKRIKNG